MQRPTRASHVNAQSYPCRVLLQRLSSLAELFGNTEFTAGTLHFAWHITTVAWWALALLPVLARRGSLSIGKASDVIAGAAVASAALPIIFARGEHLSWVAFSLVAGLALFPA
jgi:hypothetical protein